MKGASLKFAGKLLPLSCGLALLLSAGCQRSGGGPKADGSDKSTATVTIVKPARKTIDYKIAAPGEIQAFAQTPMFARISGYVETVAKDIGDPIEKDDVILALSVPERVEKHLEKKALAEKAGAEVEQANKLRDAADAALESAKAKVKEAESTRLRAGFQLRRAESQYERIKQSSGVISKDFIEENKLDFESAQATVAEVEARVKSAEAFAIEARANRDKAITDIRVAEKRQSVAEADERYEAELLRYAKLRSPFKGVVVQRHVDPGWLLEADASGGKKGEPVFVLAKTDVVRIFVDVPENDAGLVADGTPAVISVQALKGDQFKGVVTRTAFALDPKARTLRTEIDLENKNGRLRPGMYAYAKIEAALPDRLVLPATAVQKQGDAMVCFRVVDGRAVRTPVQVGLTDGPWVEVLKKRKPGPAEQWENFTGEEEVIADNLSTVSDGSPVTR